MRPHVICHMMTSLDGRLLVDDWAPGTGHKTDELVEVYDSAHEAIGADAWLSGRKTGEEFADGPFEGSAISDRVDRPVHVANTNSKEFAVLIDPQGVLEWNSSAVDGAHVIMVLGHDVTDSHLGKLAAAGVSYIVPAKKDIHLASVLEVLGTTFGIRRLMLEGGAKTNGEFIKADLVDEISVLVFATIGGKTGTPSIFEGGPEGLARHAALELKSAHLGELGSVHLRYTLHR